MLQFSNVAQIWRMSDCIVGLRPKLIALIFPFYALDIIWQKGI